jgi:transposase
MKAKVAEPPESEQRGLFRPEQLPELPVLVDAARQYAHTGKITCKNGERAEAILTHYLQTGSLRATAKHLCCSPNTILSVLNEFERSGKLDALKQRLSHKLGLVLELGADDLIERLEKKKFKPSPIDLAVLIDKKLLLDGEATQRIEETRTVRVDMSDVLGYLKTKGIAAPAIEVESSVSTAKPTESTP